MSPRWSRRAEVIEQRRCRLFTIDDGVVLAAVLGIDLRHRAQIQPGHAGPDVRNLLRVSERHDRLGRLGPEVVARANPGTVKPRIDLAKSG